jgi:threonine/homoserine/homoserine lactone efflux protein
MLVAAVLGLAFGFVGSIPIAGPISALVLSRGLSKRYTSAAMIGLGGALAEGLYAFLAFFGFSKYLAPYPWIEPVSRGVAAAILVGLGISFMRYDGAKKAEERKADSASQSFLLGLTVTLVNPTLIATWTATTTAVHSTSLLATTPEAALPFALGATVGIGGWFSLFVVIMKRYDSRFRPATLEKIVRGIGVAILGLGLWFAWRFVDYLLHRPAG